ncbi:hypothetical protein DN752_02825 [Echinicola strongylocentroti]|uniref:HEAT repeat domain-containing protein n=1 Tax=Echinicola strongylocentroti TaxID=1795355 RepID=A0A2Z4IE96_9BACT|nr:hypothetical protein [Echinicola strongylocentroti]AWW29160.1 hypothetical protein DN752_02825 [Echinicola strongylocentroti]
MKTINQIIKELIPPADYQHRNGFSNEHLVLNLTDQDKREVEKRLIEMLETKDDELIGETLAILKSTDSLTSLNKRLNSAKSATSKIIWASYINEVKGGDTEMKDLALKEFDNVKDKYSRITIFHYLSQFQDSRIKEKIRSYIDHSDYLTAYNARTALGIDTQEIVTRERNKDKNWWEFWKK